MHDLLLWLVGSVALYAVSSNIAWSLDQRDAPARSWLRRPWTDLARAAFCVGVPALALSLRIPAAADMGLPNRAGGVWSDGGPLTWPWDLVMVLSFAMATAGLAVFGRVWRARAVGDALSPQHSPLSTSTIIGLAERALLQESHWAFYRACLIASSLASRDLAVFLSLVVLALEAWSAPGLRLAYEPVRAAERFSQQLILATLSATLFLATGSSLWAFLGQFIVLMLLSASSMDLGDKPQRPAWNPRPVVPDATAQASPPSVGPRPQPASEVERIEPTVV
ncbi:MAG: hypothetical protein ACH37Z_09375 [Anaerolineae bacterium]